MRKSDRLFQLTNLLRTHQPITAKALAEKLGVSERTIYRYIDDLSLSGIPVYGEAGVGYQLSEGFELPPLQLTQQELEALIVGVNMVSSWTGKNLGQASYSLLSKIEAVLPKHLYETANERPVRIPSEHTHQLDFKHWEIIHNAIKNKQWLAMNYLSLSDTLSTRVIFPLGLFYWGGKWTFGSWCSLRGAYRDFRVDCIQSISNTQATVTLPEFVTLNDYIEYQTAMTKQSI